MRAAELTQGTVTSRDGTEIGYYKTGQGPAVVVLHGSMESARSHTLFAEALADEFTVYLPDRRGRGLSGPHRPDHGIRAGGAVVLEAARTLPYIQQIALYEPAIVADGAPHREWLTRFDQEIARGDLAGAMVTSMFGFEMAPGFLKVLPRGMLRWTTEKMMAKEERQAAPGTITMRQLAPTIHAEGTIVAELAGTFEAFRTVEADVLLMGGTKGLPGLEPGRSILEKVLPHVRRIEYDGYDHGSSSDPGGVNPTGKPEVVRRIASDVKAFFKQS